MTSDHNRVNFKIRAQPDDITCGPTCLHALYKYHGKATSLQKVIDDVCMIPSGGTLAPFLACHALQSGFDATIYTLNVRVFDPTWFNLPPQMMIKKLNEQIRVKTNEKLKVASTSYREFIQLGGKIVFEDFTATLVSKYLNQKLPIIAGLSSTYLYKCAREIPESSVADDVRGEPGGHFVVLNAFDPEKNEVLISDPYYDNPYNNHQYSIDINHLICAILLGVLTYDANLLILKPKD
jgi:hypothetical protein